MTDTYVQIKKSSIESNPSLKLNKKILGNTSKSETYEIFLKCIFYC